VTIRVKDNQIKVEEKFAIALSEKKGEAACKEVSLKIKSIFPKTAKYLFVFFTPHYQPQEILNSINFILKPQMLVGMQSPYLNFEARLIEEGLVALCINKETVELKEFFSKEDSWQNIEISLKKFLKSYAGEKEFMCSLLSHNISYNNYSRGLELAAGKSLNIFGAGFTRKYGSKNYQLVNNHAGEGLVSLIGSGVQIQSAFLSGFIPVGKPFTITKISSRRNVILEIDSKPAINLYKNYFEEKFDTFSKNFLFSLYPLGLYSEEGTRMIHVSECLDDGSLVCVGGIKEKTQGHLMIFNSQALFDSLKNKLETIKSGGEGFIFMINSLVRKRILKDYAHEEIRLIKQFLGDRFKILGIYADYSFFSEADTREINLETAHILMTVLK
jgi:hypothetical protein